MALVIDLDPFEPQDPKWRNVGGIVATLNIKNLPDGRVELVMEGPDAEIETAVDALKQKMGCFIKGLEVADAPATGEFPQFQIRH